jgi:hypothetical protein
MIDQNQDGGSATESHLTEIPFTPLSGEFTYKPYGEIIQLDWTPQTKAGNIIIPDKAQAKIGLPFFRVKVLAAGPDVKIAKAGTFVLLPQQVILHAKWDGGIAYFSSESKILAVVE